MLALSKRAAIGRVLDKVAAAGIHARRLDGRGMLRHRAALFATAESFLSSHHGYLFDLVPLTQIDR